MNLSVDNREIAARQRFGAAKEALGKLGYVLQHRARLNADGGWLSVEEEHGEHGRRFETLDDVEQFIADESAKVRAAGTMEARPGQIKNGSAKLNDRVHYTPDWGRTCRAATVTEVFPASPESISLFVISPSGTFFDQAVDYDPGTYCGGERTAVPGEPLPLITCADLEFTGGTWHWGAG